MQQLSALDAGFLQGETAQMPLHVGGLTIYEKPRAGRPDPAAVFREHVKSRIGDLGLFHRRLDPRSVRLGNPVWVTDPDLDFSYHIKEETVGAPGGRDQLNALVAELHKPLLDRERPLWQAHIIHGLKGGGFAIYMKMHHAAVDGGAVTAALNTIFQSSPEIDVEPRPSKPVAKEAAPPMVELMWNTYSNVMGMPARMMEAMPSIVKHGIETMRSGAMPGTTHFAQMMTPPPRTRFNTALTADRVFGTATMRLSEFKTLAKAKGGTINDIVLVACGGAVRRYLLDRNELPAQPLVAALPVSLRDEGDKTESNQVTMMMTNLATDVGDPLGRLAAVQKNVQISKELLNSLRAMARLRVGMPSMGFPIFNNMAGFFERIGAVDRMPPFANLFISNVPGVRQPLYCAGAEAKHNYPVSMPMHGVGLNITLTSYVDNMEFGVIGCPKVIPDPQAMADLILDEFEALKKAH